MKHVSLLILLFLTSLLAGCSDDDGLDKIPEPKGIVLELTTGSFDTKSHLYSQSNLHHVTKVYAILYYCGETTIPNVDPEKATVVASQLLQKNGIIWNPSTDQTEGNNTFELTLPEEQITLVPGKYMVLCVGLDDESGATFGLSYDAQTVVTDPTVTTGIPAFAQVGATLAQAKAVLQGTFTPTDEPQSYEKDPAKDPNNPDANPNDKDLISYGHPNMAHAELFAGWQSFDFMPDDLNVVRVELRRRVAGVLCYLSDIPYKLNNGESPYRVTKVRLNLSGAQNTEVSLLRKQQTVDGERNDFGTKPNASRVICEFDLMGFGANADRTLYQIPTQHLQDRQQLPNTILMGAYLLPVNKDDASQKPTFEIELLGYPFEDNVEGNITQEELQKPISSITSFPALYEGQDMKTFPIHPNMIYHIGQKLETDITEGDYPESLSGTKVTVKEENWENTEVEVEFPSVPVNPMLSLMDQEGQVYKTEAKVSGDDYYVFDCIGSSIFTLKISSSILYDDWVLTVIGANNQDDPWLKFWDQAQKKYVKQLEGTGEQVVQIRMDDYVSVADWQNNQKTRIIILQLQAKENGQLVDNSISTISIEQYNALIVNMDGSRGTGYRGFSHFNFGAKRNKTTGKVIEEGKKIDWGYFKSLNVTPYWADGQLNFKEFISKAWIESFMGCAIQVCSLGEYGQATNVDIQNVKADDPFWYLPACDEFEWFLKQYKGQAEDLHILKDEFYWTCNQAGLRRQAFAHKLTSANMFVWDKISKTNTFYARQACHAQ